MTRDFEKLKGSDNYHTWCLAVKNYLDFKGYGKCVETVVDAANVVTISEKDATKLTACKALLVLCSKKYLYPHQ